MISFSVAELERFAAATGDRNPLHCCDDYARRTPFGSRVVFGMLGVLRALPALRGSGAPTRLRAQFHRPLFTGRAHEVTLPRPGVASLLAHGDRALTVSLERGAREPLPARVLPSAVPMREVAAEFDAALAWPARTIRYRCAPQLLRELAGDQVPDWTDTDLAVLAAASYLAGMELPGRQALLVGVDMRFATGSADGHALELAVTLDRYDERRRLVSCRVDVQTGDACVAQLRVRALYRQAPFAITLPARLPLNAARLAGRTAVVVGGSRGVGAHVAAHLARCGARVHVVYEHSTDAVVQLQAALGEAAALLTAHQGDARDPAFWRTFAARLDRVDLLVCCAWPAFRKLGQAASALDEGLAHLGDGVAMVTTPLLAMLPAMTGPDPDVVMLSSDLVPHPDPAYWHYTAGKAAVEGLCTALAPAHPKIAFHVVRPTVLATDYAPNWTAAGDPAAAARALLEACACGGGGVHVLGAA